MKINSIREAAAEAIPYALPAADGAAIADDLVTFLTREFPQRPLLLGPILPVQGLMLLYGPRGLGKTHMALGMAYAVATGSEFLKYNAAERRRVLFVDGEMPAVAMQERLATVVASRAAEPPEPSYFRIITPDLQARAIPDLATFEGQAWLEAPIGPGCDLLVIDNISALMRIKENEADDWTPVQAWLLSLRRRGVAVMLVHHAGKDGRQRGTSRREDVLDTVISLRRPTDYRAEEGARFEVHVEKGRSIHGADAEPFEARLEVRENIALWTTRSLDDANLARAVDVFKAGLSVRDAAAELNISKSAAGRLRQKAKVEGLVS
jgi:putative DNA primase/helicase